MPVENAAGGSLSLTSGTPLWASLLLSLLAVVGAHLLTSYREGKKRRHEAMETWRSDALALLVQISDEAQAHYTEADSAATRLSAQRILSKLKRFGAVMRSVTCLEPSDTKRTSDSIADLHTAITGPDDFQNEGRTPRQAGDPVILHIMECEDRMRTNILHIARKPKE